LKACEGSDFYARRDTALLRLMLASGTLLSEVANIRVDELVLVNRVVIVRREDAGIQNMERAVVIKT
jgi:site-specific recombinase XerD